MTLMIGQSSAMQKTVAIAAWWMDLSKTPARKPVEECAEPFQNYFGLGKSSQNAGVGKHSGDVVGTSTSVIIK